MGERITVVGGTDSSIAVTLDGTQALNLAKQFVDELDSYYQNNNLNILDVTASPTVDDRIGYGIITQGGAAYTAGNGYDYIVAGGFNAGPITVDPVTGKLVGVNPETADLLDAPVTINSAMTTSQFVRVIAGNLQGFTYNAGQESGKLAAGNAGSNVVFNGNTVNGGSWDIRTGAGNDTIITGAGDNSVFASTGANSINITAGNSNVVLSEGQDSIFASHSSTAINRVTLTAGTSTSDHSTVDINKGAAVTDTGFYNVVTVGGGSTIEGGTYGTYTFDGSYDSNLNHMSGGTSSSITATGDLQVVQGDSNTINASQSLTFLNGVGNTQATVNGSLIGFGAGGLNYTLNATGSAGGFFVADVGNETLNASASTAALQIYANTVVGAASSNFVASGGSGNDTLVAGTGNSTFSGGAGDNLFMFTKEVAENGNTVITDFSKNANNDKIALYNYGLDENSLADLLKASSNDAKGDAVLNLNGHTITIEGVSVSELNVNQFEVLNAPTSKS